MDQWQKCPVCDGTGHVWNAISTGSQQCNCCNGHGIINIHSGYPPEGDKIIITTSGDGVTINWPPEC